MKNSCQGQRVLINFSLDKLSIKRKENNKYHEEPNQSIDDDDYYSYSKLNKQI